MLLIYAGPDFGLLVIFAVIVLLVLIAIFEMIGLPTRVNLAVFSAFALALLVVPTLAAFMSANLRYTLFTSGAVLAIIILLYGLATARRLQNWRWFTALLFGGMVALVGLLVMLNRLTPPFSGSDALVVVALCCLPAICTLVYAARSPNIATPPAMNPRGMAWRVPHRATRRVR